MFILRYTIHLFWSRPSCVDMGKPDGAQYQHFNGYLDVSLGYDMWTIFLWKFKVFDGDEIDTE